MDNALSKDFLSLVSSSHIHIAKSLLAPTDGKFRTSGEGTRLISCHADLLVLSVSWALPVFLR